MNLGTTALIALLVLSCTMPIASARLAADPDVIVARVGGDVPGTVSPTCGPGALGLVGCALVEAERDAWIVIDLATGLAKPVRDATCSIVFGTTTNPPCPI